MTSLNTSKDLNTEKETEVKGLKLTREGFTELHASQSSDKPACARGDSHKNPNAASAASAPSLPEVRLEFKGGKDDGDTTMTSVSCHTVPIQSSREVLTSSGTLLKWDCEEYDRLFKTKRDSRRIRTLKSLRLLPKTPKTKTFAEIGIQAEIGDYTACRQAIEQLNDQTQMVASVVEECRSRSEIIVDLRGQIGELEHVLKETTHIVENDFKIETEARKAGEQAAKAAKSEANKRANELKSMKKALGDLKSIKDELEVELREVTNALEKKELDSAFLQEEKEDAEKLANERWEKLEETNEKYMRMEEQRDDYQALYTHAKAEYSNTLGRYMAKLNSALEDKRFLIKKGAKQVAAETKPAEALRTAELFLEREEENCRLVEQIEYLSAQSVAQDLKIQQLLEELDDYKDISKYLFSSDGQLKGTVEAELVKKRLIRRYNSENHRVLGELIEICSRMSGLKAQKQVARKIREASVLSGESEELTSNGTLSDPGSEAETSSSSERFGLEQEAQVVHAATAAAAGDGKMKTTSPIKRLIGILKNPMRTVPKIDLILESDDEDSQAADDTRSTDGG